MDNIEIKNEGMQTVIYLKGRIDTNAAPKVEEVINASDLKKSVIIDVNELEYVSSSGLRVILRLAKKHPDLKIINANSEVYEIFEVTGFTDIMNIEKAYKTMSVEGCDIIGEGANGIVYRIDDDTIVKVYKNPDSLDEIINERNLAKRAFVLGIPTAISYDIVKVGDKYASVFEMLKAESLQTLVKQDPEHIDDYIQTSVELLKIIHDTKVRAGDMPPIQPIALKWVHDLDQYLPAEVIEKLEILICHTGCEDQIIHGDFHFKNVMVQNGETLLIDMDTLCTGHPVYEFAAMYNAYKGFSILDHSNEEKFLGLSFDTTCYIWHKTLELYFNTTDEAYLNSIEEKARLIACIRLMRRCIKHNINQDLVEYCKQSIIELSNQLDTLEFE